MDTKQQKQKPKTKNTMTKNAKKTQKIVKTQARLQQTGVLSGCAAHYASCIIDPFNAPHGACIPSELLPLPSEKHSITTRGTLNLGTTGFGYILVNPNLASDGVVAVTTTAASVGGTATALNAFTNLTSVTLGAGPATAATITAGGFQGRVVSYGVRARYSGALNNRNGEAVSYEDPDHQNLQTNTFATIQSDQQGTHKNITNSSNEWQVQFSYSGPVAPGDVQFQAQQTPLNIIANAKIGGLLISGAAGDLWAYEIVSHLEFVGNGTTERTASHADPQGMAHVVQAAKTITAVKPLEPADKPTFIDLIKQGITSVLPIISSGAQVVRNIASVNLPQITMGIANTIARSQQIGASNRFPTYSRGGGNGLGGSMPMMLPWDM